METKVKTKNGSETTKEISAKIFEIIGNDCLIFDDSLHTYRVPLPKKAKVGMVITANVIPAPCGIRHFVQTRDGRVITVMLKNEKLYRMITEMSPSLLRPSHRKITINQHKKGA